MPKSVAEVLAKYLRNTQGASQSYKDGVMAVSESPTAKAAANEAGYLEGVRRAAEEGRWREGLLSVSLADWQQKTATLGAQRYGPGIVAASAKTEQFLSQLLPFTESLSREIKSMPKGTKEDSRARMNAAFDKMSNFRFRKKR